MVFPSAKLKVTLVCLEILVKDPFLLDLLVSRQGVGKVYICFTNEDTVFKYQAYNFLNVIVCMQRN